jgi:ABC-type sulfate transport system permease component
MSTLQVISEQFRWFIPSFIFLHVSVIFGFLWLIIVVGKWFFQASFRDIWDKSTEESMATSFFGTSLIFGAVSVLIMIFGAIYSLW